MIDYEILKAIWWLFIGVLLVGFTIMDGQDMGVGTLLPFLGKNDSERRIMINSVAPHWDGNQVWFVPGGGAMFAAWPLMYAIAFSGFYWAMLVILAALMFRPLAFDYRSKVPAERWRSSWDWLLFVGFAWPAWLSATCCKACRFTSMNRCVRSTRAASSVCSIRSDCCAVSSRC